MATKIVRSSMAAILAATLVLWPSAAHAEVQQLGLRCNGDILLRCAWINYDTVNNRIRAYGRIQVATAHQYHWSNVDVAWIEIDVASSPSGPWTEIMSSTVIDPDVEDIFDDGRTNLVSCGAGTYFRAYFHWYGQNLDNHDVASGYNASSTVSC